MMCQFCEFTNVTALSEARKSSVNIIVTSTTGIPTVEM
jgi:hypothetical protein